MKMTYGKATVELLSLDGVPHAQIVAGIKLRRDEDCVAAYLYIRENILPEPKHWEKIARAADHTRDTALILSRIEPVMASGLAAVGDPEAQRIFMELNALCVEAMVRGFGACFPEPAARNN